jgi:radical SAM protein with 4Fe4S-binding SPASM domain
MLKRAQALMPNDEVLALDPWSGSWTVLQAPRLDLFRTLDAPRPLYELRSNPWIPPDETDRLISYLLDLNLLQVANWPVLHGPVMPEPFTYPSFFSIHVTEDCNFRCRYCYADAVSKGKRMTAATARKVIERILESYGRHEITIEFHGGEPLLAMDIIEEAVNHASLLFRKMGRPPCTYLLQTNGSLLRKDHIEFFRANRIAVGVSMDGPAEIHDRNRIFPGGKGTHSAVVKGMELLRGEDIPGGILAVIEDPSDYIEVCRYILSLGYTGFRLNHMVCQGRGEAMSAALCGRASGALESARPSGTLKGSGLSRALESTRTTDEERGAAFAEGLLALADFLYEHKLRTRAPFLDVWPLNIMLFHLLSPHRPFMCMRSPCGAGSHALGFDYEGNVYPCEQLTNFEELRMGSVFAEQPVSPVGARACGTFLHDLVMTSPVVGEQKRRTVENIEECRDCAFRMFCAGGCTAEAFAVNRTLLREDAQCAFYRKAFEGLLWKLHDNPGLVELTGQFRSSLPFDDFPSPQRGEGRVRGPHP